MISPTIATSISDFDDIFLRSDPFSDQMGSKVSTRESGLTHASRFIIILRVFLLVEHFGACHYISTTALQAIFSSAVIVERIVVDNHIYVVCLILGRGHEGVRLG